MHLDTAAEKLKGVNGAYKNRKNDTNEISDLDGAPPLPLETSAVLSQRLEGEKRVERLRD